VSEQEWRARFVLPTSAGHDTELLWSSVCLGLKRAKQAAAELALGCMPPQQAGRLPVIEGFFCKKIPDKKQLLRHLEAVERADDADKDERRTQLKAQLTALETIDVHKEAQVLTSSLSGGRRVFDVQPAAFISHI
jgi:hypothetical protein